MVNAEVPKLDTQLVRALREGSTALPNDLGRLRSYLGIIEALLAEKASELEPSWDQACAAAAEIATLQNLEASVAERAIAIRADSLEAVGASSRSGAPSAPTATTATWPRRATA